MENVRTEEFPQPITLCMGYPVSTHLFYILCIICYSSLAGGYSNPCTGLSGARETWRELLEMLLTKAS